MPALFESIDLQFRDLARIAENMFDSFGNNVLGRAANARHEQFEQRLIAMTRSEDAKYQGAATLRKREQPTAFLELWVIHRQPSIDHCRLKPKSELPGPRTSFSRGGRIVQCLFFSDLR